MSNSSAQRPGYAVADFSDPEGELARLRRQAEVVSGWERGVWSEAGCETAGLILELGCGPGFVLSQLKGMSQARLVGVDLDRDLIRRMHSGMYGLQADCRHLPFDSRIFDLVISRFTLIFIPDPLSVLREARRVLRSGGALVLEEADPFHMILDPCPALWTELMQARASAIKRRGGDIEVSRRLRTLAREAGFVLERTAVLAASSEMISVPLFSRLAVKPVAEGVDPQDLPPERMRAAKEEIARWGESPDSFGICLLLMVVGRAP